MNSIAFPPAGPVWKASSGAWLALACSALLLYLVFRGAVHELWRVWMVRPEYSFGVFIPFLSAFLIWQRKDRLAQIRPEPSWHGLWFVGLGLFLRFFGDLALSTIIQEYGLVVAIFGVALCHLGWRGVRVILAPLLFLFFMIQLPEFILQSLSQRLQMISSVIGVAIIRAFDISVHLEGNLIDLGSMKLQVAEACSGLRYLFSLVVLGFIAAYFFKGPLWKRMTIFLSSIPITVLMNSLRIGLVGVTVEHWGRRAAEGVLHEFEGLVIFMGCAMLLLAEMWILARLGRDRMPLAQAFGLDLPSPTPSGARIVHRPVAAALFAAIGFLAAGVVAGATVRAPTPDIPARRGFADFPLQIADYTGRRGVIDRETLAVLKANDHLLVDYTRPSGGIVNLYIQWFDTQDNSTATHSPRLCIPGGGWEIVRLERHELPEVTVYGKPLAVNRATISKGESSVLVYYWFQQRGRVTTNEYGTKLLIFWDSLRRKRSDGSMVRVITPILPMEKTEVAEARLVRFTQQLASRLPPFIPD